MKKTGIKGKKDERHGTAPTKGASTKGKVWVISVDMGYGHQRAAYPLKDIAFERIITANNDRIISEKEHATWERTRKIYEFFSRTRDIPFLGNLIFDLYDQLQKISPFFPFRDLSKPNFSVLRVKSLVKKGLCASLIDYTSKEDIPIVATYFIPALAYDYHGKQCYCIVTDSDINRIWVSDKPEKSRIIYFSPCKHATLRLEQYGVPTERIIDTGFPLPKENIGERKEILKKDLAARLVNLDPHGVFFEKYRGIIEEKFGLGKNVTFKELKRLKNHPLTLMYSVGGAGVGKEIGMQLVKSLKKRILDNEIRVVLNGGTKLEMISYFKREIDALGLKEQIGKNIIILFAVDKKSYFELMNSMLRETDILWTKPSEMSFYTALGLPIIIAPPIGAHENYNMQWLEHIGSGFVQENPEYADNWLFYWIEDGRLADAAMQGFLDAPVMGTYNIENYLFKGQLPGNGHIK